MTETKRKGSPLAWCWGALVLSLALLYVQQCTGTRGAYVVPAIAIGLATVLIRLMGTSLGMLTTVLVMTLCGVNSPVGLAGNISETLKSPFVITIFAGFVFINFLMGPERTKPLSPMRSRRAGETMGVDGELIRTFFDWLGSKAGRATELIRMALSFFFASLFGFCSSSLAASVAARFSDGSIGSGKNKNLHAAIALWLCVVIGTMFASSVWSLFFIGVMTDDHPLAILKAAGGGLWSPWCRYTYTSWSLLIVPAVLFYDHK